MRQMMRRVSLEFNALLEVNQIKLNLIRAVHQGGVCNEPVQEGRLTRTRLTGHKQMLRRPPSKSHRLQGSSAGPANWHHQFLATVTLPVVGFGRGNLLEWNLDLH